MLVNDKNKNRIGIYFFYDKDGIVDQYVSYFLDDFCMHVKDLIIVCNGKLSTEGKNELEKYGEILVRENTGFDVWAYKSAMDHVGWKKLEQYDEVVLLNSTIMGPIYPFSETFEKMSAMDLDFWGLTKYFKVDGDPFGCIKYGYIPDHIQSHFIVCRKSLVESAPFQEYWDKMPMIHNYSEAIGLHEAIFTKHFEDKGFQWDVSVNVDELRDYSGYPLMMCPKKLMQEYRCPIFKRRSFFHTISDYLRNTTGEQTSEMFEYLENETNYDVNFIWDTILRNYNQYDIVKNMNLTYCLPTNIGNPKQVKEKLANKKVALIMHLYFPDLLEESFKYASSMPEYADVYITTDTEDKKVEIENVFSKLVCNKLDIRVIENRGRDVSSLLVGVKDIVMDYEIACFAHDKKTAQVKPGSVGASFGYKCFENTLANKTYVVNVIDTFLNNSRLGIYSPPEPNHADFYPTLGCEWGPNFKVTKKLAKKLKLNVPIDKDKAPVAPLGTMFWFRPKAMKKLFDNDWEYTDFPKEPNKIDDTLLHAIERIYPFVVQSEGYYPAIGMSDKFAAIEYNNLKFYLRGFNKTVANNGFGPYYDRMWGEVGYAFHQLNSIKCLIKRLVKITFRKILPHRIYVKLRKRKAQKIKNNY